MHMSLQMLVVLSVVCAACTGPAPAPGRLTRAKQPRATRGFKNTEMMTARGFGKRNYHAARTDSIRRPRSPRVFRNSELSVARGFGKRDGFAKPDEQQVAGLDSLWDVLENSQEHGQQEQAEDKTADSVPVDWFVDELLNDSDFAKTVVRKFIDLNQDGMLSSDELLRDGY